MVFHFQKSTNERSRDHRDTAIRGINTWTTIFISKGLAQSNSQANTFPETLHTLH